MGAALCLMLAILSAHASTIEPGVTRTLARSRAARLSDLHYQLTFKLTAQATTIPGTETLSFVDGAAGDLALDYRDGAISSAMLNGREISPTLENGHLNQIKTLLLYQHDVLPEGDVWPIANQLSLDYYGQPGLMKKAIKVDGKTPEHAVYGAVGSACPSLIFAHSGDFGYGRFVLDAQSEKTAARELPEAPAQEQDSLQRSQLWGALWDNVHVARSAPVSYVDLVLKALPTEADESLARIQDGRVATALHAYLSEQQRTLYTPRLEAVTASRMLQVSTLGLRIVNFRTFTAAAKRPQAMAQIKALLSGTLTVPGMPLKPLDRWNLIGHLIAMGDADAGTLYAAEKAEDHGGEGQKYACALEAGTPSATVKARYFDEYLHSPDRQADWITQSLRPFNSWNQTSLTEPYLARALDALTDIKQHRKIFFLGAWLDAFLEGQHSPQAQAVVHAWLGRASLDADLRLKVLEVSDALDWTVLIRQRFPQ